MIAEFVLLGYRHIERVLEFISPSQGFQSLFHLFTLRRVAKHCHQGQTVSCRNIQGQPKVREVRQWHRPTGLSLPGYAKAMASIVCAILPITSAGC